MLTHNQLVFTLQQALPALTHGRDYWVAQPVKGDQQTGDARIVSWITKVQAEPIASEIAGWLETWGYAWREFDTAQLVRDRRSLLLIEADVAYNKAVDSGDSASASGVSLYRQALRDVPEQPGFPFDVAWPQMPTIE